MVRWTFKETMMKTLLSAFFALLILFWIGMGQQIYTHPQPHVGYNILDFIPVLLLGSLVAFLIAWRFSSKLWWVAGGLTILSSIAVFYIYKANILVPYDEWIGRGMPNRSWLPW